MLCIVLNFQYTRVTISIKNNIFANVYMYIYIGHLINDMKLDSSQFIYYPKREELLFS